MTAPLVLVVDDEPGMRHAILRVLEPHCRLLACGSAREALATARSEPPDLAFVDVRLPDRDGFQLMQSIQEAHPQTDIVLMTGSLHDMDQKLVRSLRERAFFFLTKPFGRELLLTVFDRWREMRELTRRDHAHTARLEHDLREAQAFQLGLIPPAHTRIGEVELHGRFRPCEAVSGDLYDYAATDDGGVAMLVCDVSGHGVAAAMLSGFLKTSFQASHVDAFDPLAVVARIRDALVQSETERFVTLIAARIRGHRLEYVNAGHPDALLRAPDGRIERLQTTGPLCTSAFPDACWGMTTHELAPGASVLLYTDGVEEARGEGELFGVARLEAALAAEADGRALLERILREVDAHGRGRPADDDLTLLLARVGPDASP